MHDMAFGAGIEEEKIPELVAYANNTLSEVDFGTDTIEVDYIFNNNDLDNRMLTEFAKYMPLYGNGIPQPMFAFELLLTSNNIDVIGKKGDTLKISYNGITFIKFRATELIEEIKTFAGEPAVKVTILGRSQLNSFNGRTSTQVIIDNFKINKIKTEDLI